MVSPRKEKDYIIVDIGDMHIGSIWGVRLPKTYQFVNRNSKANPIQILLYKKLEEFVSIIKIARKGRKLVLVSHGEIVEGVHHGTTELDSFLEKDQIRMAIDLFDWFLQGIGFSKDDKLYFTESTESHTGKRSSLDAFIAEDFGAEVFIEPDKDEGGGVYLHPAINFKKYGVRFHIQHHAMASSGTRSHTKGNSLRSALRSLETEYRKMDLEIPRYIIGGHYHTYVEETIQTNKIDVDKWNTIPEYCTGIIAPCWKAPDSFIYRIGKSYIPVSIGGIYILLNSDGTSKHYVPHINLDFRPKDIKI